MEKIRLKQYKATSGDDSSYFRETSAVNDIALSKSSAAIGNLGDLLKSGPVTFPNILAPDYHRCIPISKSQTIAPNIDET